MGKGRGQFAISVALTTALVALQIPARVLPSSISTSARAAVSGLDAQADFDTHTVIARPGDTIRFDYRVLNTGTITWVKGTSQQVDLAVCAQGPESRSVFHIACPTASADVAAWNSGWATPTLYATQPVDLVAPAQFATYTWSVTVPASAAPGEYTFLSSLLMQSAAGAVLFSKQVVRIPNGNVFVVNNNGDVTGCTETACSLRGAMDAANAAASPGTDTIVFNLSLAFGGTTISPTSPLPAITESVVIDGTTQPSFKDGLPVVAIDGVGVAGSSGGPESGLTLRAASTIRGLWITRFGGWGIDAPSGGGGFIAGNAVLANGTAGNAATGGIHLLTPNYRIGAEIYLDGNTIGDNLGQGIEIGQSDAPSTLVVQNFMGGSAINGLLVRSPDALIQDNFISRNGRAGISIESDTGRYWDNMVRNNAGPGVLLAGSGNTFDQNDIRANGGGVFMGFPNVSVVNNNFTGNIVRDNTGRGFELRGPGAGELGITNGNAIRPCSPDESCHGSITNNSLEGILLTNGANDGIAPPTVKTSDTGADVTASGEAGPLNIVDVYVDSSGNGADEGDQFVGSALASDSIPASWSLVITGALVEAIRSGAVRVRATQTDTNGNTSAFSGVPTATEPLVGVAQCRFTTGVESVSTRLLPNATVELLSGRAVVADTLADTGGAYAFTGLQPNAHYNVRYDGVASNEQSYRCGVDNVPTNALGGGTVRLPTPLLNRLNHLWLRPVHLHSGVPIGDVIPAAGMSTWYRIGVRPHERLTIRLTNPPTDYTVLAFTDLFQVAKLLKQQGATLASIRRLTGTQDRAAPDLDSPDLDSPDLDSPDLDSPDLDSPDLDSPDLDSPDLDSPDLDSPDLDSPDLDSPDLDSPDLDSGGKPVPVAQEIATYGSVYVAAQRRGLRAFSANPGVVAETIVLNTRTYQGDVYIRVRPHGDLSSNELFTITATTEGGEGCQNAALTQLPPAPQSFVPGPKKTLILTNTMGPWFAQGTTTKAQFLGALSAVAARSEVLGVVVDLANDTNIQSNFTDWRAAAGKTCVAQANIVAQSIKQLVDLYRAQYGIEYLVLAGPDAAIPFFRVRDSAELSRESRYSGGLDALSATETALVEDYVLSDAFYGASGVTTRSGHDFFLSDLGIGRLVESRDDIMSYLARYTAANGSVRVQSAFSSGYGFLSDLATSTTSSLSHAGASVSSLNSDTWTADDLRASLFGATRYQFISLQGHGRSNRLVPANDGPRFLSSEIAAVTDGRFAGTLVFSIACHLEGFNLQDADVLAGNPNVAFPEAFLAQGATAVGVSGFGYGHFPLLKNGEVVFAMLSDEIAFTADLSGTAYGPRGVPIGKAMNISKLRFLNSLADVRGIEAKVINETMVYGLPMFAVQTLNTFSRPTAASIVPPLTQLSAPLGLYLGQPPAQSFTLNPHTLGAGTFFDAGTLDDTATIPLRPILPSKSMNVQATVGGADVVPRGAVLYSADYQDSAGFVPVLAVPATQDAPTSPPTKYKNTALAPSRLVRLNEYAGDVALFVPFQYQGQGASGTARKYSSITTRLYYSTLTGDAALVDAPTIQSVTLGRNPNGTVQVDALVAGRTLPGVQEVFATFTATSGPLVGHWKSIALAAGTPTPGNTRTCLQIGGAQSCAFTNVYSGVIDPADGTGGARDPLALRVDIQAVGGNALIGYATNGGLHYQIVDETATASAPKRSATLTLTAAPPFATYLSRFTVSAKLVDAADGTTAIKDKTIFFKVGGSFATGVTGADGIATATLTANAPPNPSPRLAYHITASLPEDIDVLAAPAESDLRVTPGPTQLISSTGVTVDYSDSAVIAHLLLTSRGIGLQDQPVTIDLGSGRVVTTYTDRAGNVKLDTLDFSGLAPGVYTGTVTFKGENVSQPDVSRFAATSTPISFTVGPESATLAPKMKPQAAGSVRLTASLTQAADGSLGDMSKATVHFVVRNQAGGVVTEGTTAAAAAANGTGTWSAPATLPTGLYTVDLDVRGSFTSAPTSSQLAVFEPRSVTAGAGVVFAGPGARGVTPGSRLLFAYVIRYSSPTSTIPVGLDVALFKPSGTTFLSFAIDWLVVTRPAGVGRAEFAGTGRLGGQPGWSFRAIATTAGEDGTFELRIWNSSGSFTSPNYQVSGRVEEGGIFIR